MLRKQTENTDTQQEDVSNALKLGQGRATFFYKGRVGNTYACRPLGLCPNYYQPETMYTQMGVLYSNKTLLAKTDVGLDLALKLKFDDFWVTETERVNTRVSVAWLKPKPKQVWLTEDVKCSPCLRYHVKQRERGDTPCFSPLPSASVLTIPLIVQSQLQAS